MDHQFSTDTVLAVLDKLAEAVTPEEYGRLLADLEQMFEIGVDRVSAGCVANRAKALRGTNKPLLCNALESILRDHQSASLALVKGIENAERKARTPSVYRRGKRAYWGNRMATSQHPVKQRSLPGLKRPPGAKHPGGAR